MGLPGLCLLLLAAAPAPEGEQLTIDAVVRLQGQVGTDVGVYSSQVGTDLQLEPGVIVRERSKTALLTLAYIPWLLYTPLEPNRLLKLHRFRAQVEGSFSQRSGITVSGIIWLGDQSYSPAVNLNFPSGPTGPTFPGSLPPVTVLKVFEATTRLGFYWLVSRELRLDVTMGFGYTEGVNPVDRLTLPLQRGPVVELKATYGVTKADELVPFFRYEFLEFGPIFRSIGSPSPGGGTVPVQNLETGLTIAGSEFALRWLHKVSSTINTELAGGVGFARQSAATAVAVPGGTVGQVPAETSFYPVAEARLRDQLVVEEHGLALTAVLSLSPVVNQFTATVAEQLNGLVSLSYGLSARWRLEALTSSTLSVNPRQLYVRGEVQAVWQPDVHVAIAAGTRVGYVDYYTPTQLNGISWVVYLAVTAGTGTLP
jgi:hypothetical protein